MFASANLDLGRPPVSGVLADAGQCHAVKMQQVGGSKLEWPIRLKKCFNHFYDDPILRKRILRFPPRKRLWILDDLRFRSATVTVFRHHCARSSAFAASSNSSTISRVIRSFSILALP
jgi:hypothetical protein